MLASSDLPRCWVSIVHIAELEIQVLGQLRPERSLEQLHYMRRKPRWRYEPRIRYWKAWLAQLPSNEFPMGRQVAGQRSRGSCYIERDLNMLEDSRRLENRACRNAVSLPRDRVSGSK